MGPETRSATSRKPAHTDPLAFVRGWLRSPKAVGGPFASSIWTAERIAEVTLDAACDNDAPVIELGAGTGPITEALLRAGCPLDRLVVVERDPGLCSFLEERFPGLRVVNGDALRLRDTLAEGRVRSARVVLSGLPMRVVPAAGAARLYSDAFELMPPGGAIIQYTYGLRSPLDPSVVEGLDLSATFVGREWRNLPPMAVWRYQKRA
ncbi:MAG TPA: rRNA adenine N-6-methyltransferase family protein [Vineibacter sp.]|nr:rRNA adenine N-6-methyltransferase family protein [Vineibacter sp.]